MPGWGAVQVSAVWESVAAVVFVEFAVADDDVGDGSGVAAADVVVAGVGLES